MQSRHQPPTTRHARRGISLIEVLISMFVLLFGLMGVAAIFPVGSHYVLEGDKRDRSSSLAQIAFEELQARDILRPEYWYYANANPAALGNPLILSSSGLFYGTNINTPVVGVRNTAGAAFVIDPLGAAAPTSTPDPQRLRFPSGSPVPTAWPAWAGITQWPVRRMTLPSTTGPLATAPAETIFRLRNDLAVEQPEAGDRPSVQRWRVDNNGTATDYTDDTLLARDYVGDYSWLATVVPVRNDALLALQPAARLGGWYEVSTAVFYKRDTVPSATLPASPGSPGSERLIAGEFLNSSELAIYDSVYDDPDVVDSAVDGLKPGNWVAVMGVNQVTGAFMLKWYKILALDDETDTLDTRTANATSPANGKQGRYLMVQGPEWPQGTAGVMRSNWNLRVAILPGIIDVYTRVMQMGQGTSVAYAGPTPPQQGPGRG